MTSVLLRGCHVVTMNAERAEYESGYLAVEGNQISAVGAGPPPAELELTGALIIDGTGCLLTPGLINTHHHLYQWATRGVSQDETLFGWLTTLYPIWAGIDEGVVHAAAAAGLGWLALTGTTTSSDHHYVFPARGGDLLEAEVTAARRIGLRFHPARGSMDLGRSNGGLPPDSVVEDRDAVLVATAEAIDRYDDPAEDSHLEIVVGRGLPFRVTRVRVGEAA